MSENKRLSGDSAGSFTALFQPDEAPIQKLEG
jgi:hypothetical protein